jgi:hypothetical protein
MGTFVGTDVSLGREKVKSAEENPLMESKNPKDWNYNDPGEPDYSCNGNPGEPNYENGDHGDLPSFSIKRLRRLPLRVTSADQLASTRPDDDRGEQTTCSDHPMQVQDQDSTSQVVVQNGEIEDRNSNGKIAIEERNPDNSGSENEPAGNTVAENIAKPNSTLEGEDAVLSPNIEVEHKPTEVVHDPPVGVSPDSSIGVSDKDSSKLEPPAPIVADSSQDENGNVREPLTDENGKVREPAEVASPGIVQILPAVMGSRFASPGETTDEETDSPRSSEGFSYPDSDAMTLPYSGQIMYPSRFSCAQSSNGPSLLQYSGSMSLRSDSSTTSNRSFAFPILAPPEWNSSPARMAKAQPRRKNRFDGCCFFRLNRSRYKY